MRCAACIRSLLLAALLGAPVLAQEPTPVLPGERLPVVLDGRVLFEVGESGTWSPQQRAAEVTRILRAAVADPEPVNLLLSERDGHPIIRMGEWHLLTVTDSDVLPGMDAGEQAQRWLQATETALIQARLERSPGYLGGAWLRLLAALAAAGLAHWALWRAARRLPLALRRWRGLPIRTAPDDKPAWQLAIELGCLAGQLAAWGAAALYGTEQLPASRQLRYDAARVLGGSLRAPLFTLGERVYSGLDLLWLIGAVVLLWLTVSLVTALLGARLQRATGANRGALQPVATVVRSVLLGVGLIVILQVAGLNLSSLAILASVLGVGIGFGLQNLANSVVSGVVLSFERPIKPGDFVSLGSLQGTVERIGGRSTIVRTLDRVSIIVPNAKLLEGELINWSYGDPLVRLHVAVGVAYGSDLERVRAALLDAAHQHPAVLADPRPEVYCDGFGDNSLDFDLLVWTRDPPGQAMLKSDLYYQIDANLRRAGIDVPFPQRTLHLPAAEIDAAIARWNGVPAPAPAVEAAPQPAPATGRPAWQALDLAALVDRMRGPQGVGIEDRRHLWSLYPRCFVGADAVQWMMRACDLDRDQAVRLGQRLVESGLAHHVLDEHPFLDGTFFYRFRADESAAAFAHSV